MGITHPVILWVDGHTSHIGAVSVWFCHTNHIILFLLLQNVTFVIQPFDVSIFSDFKDGWIESVCRWTITHFNELITRKNFPSIFRQVWERITNDKSAARIAANAFRRAGIFPLNVEAVDFLRLITKVLMTDDTQVKLNEKTPKKVRQLTTEVTTDGKIRPTPGSIQNDDNVKTEAQVNEEEAMPELGLAIIYDNIEPKGFCSHGKLTKDAYVTSVTGELVQEAQAKGLENVQAKQNEKKKAKPVPHKPNTEEITRDAEAKTLMRFMDDDKVTEVNIITGEESVLLQPRVLIKTDYGKIVGVVQLTMMPQKETGRHVGGSKK